MEWTYAPVPVHLRRGCRNIAIPAHIAHSALLSLWRLIRIANRTGVAYHDDEDHLTRLFGHAVV